MSRSITLSGGNICSSPPHPALNGNTKNLVDICISILLDGKVRVWLVMLVLILVSNSDNDLTNTMSADLRIVVRAPGTPGLAPGHRSGQRYAQSLSSFPVSCWDNQCDQVLLTGDLLYQSPAWYICWLVTLSNHQTLVPPISREDKENYSRSIEHNWPDQTKERPEGGVEVPGARWVLQSNIPEIVTTGLSSPGIIPLSCWDNYYSPSRTSHHQY